MKKLLAMLLLAFSSVINADETPLEISTDYVSKYCDDNFAMYEIKFSNPTTDWIEIDSVSLAFDSESANTNINIVVGSQLAFWQEAQELKERENSIKLNLFLGAIGTLGAVSNSDLGDIAALTAGAGLTAQGLGKLQDKYRGNLVPKNHLLSGGIIIPPNLAIKRWVLLFSDNEISDSFVKEIQLGLFNNDEQILNKTIDIRSEHEEFRLNCQWQKPITPRSYKPKCSNSFDPRCR